MDRPTLVKKEMPSEARRVDPAKLGDLAKWASAGFATMAGLLTYLGITGGALDRILRENPSASLWIFALLGLGVIASLFAASLEPDTYIRVPVALGALLTLGVITQLLLPSLVSVSSAEWLGWGLLVLGAIVLGVFFRRWMSMAAGLLVIAVGATSMGLYGAAKLSVVSKGQPVDLQVRAQLATEDGGRVVKVSLRGGRQDYPVGRVELQGLQDQVGPGQVTRTVIASERFSPDAVENVTEDFTFPVVLSRWSTVVVLTCLDKGCAPEEAARFAGSRAAVESRVSGILTQPAAGGTVSAHVGASDLQPNDVLHLEVFRGRTLAGHLVMTSTVLANGDGTAEWSADLPPGEPGEWVRISGEVETRGAALMVSRLPDSVASIRLR